MEVIKTVNWAYFSIALVIVFLGYILWAKKWMMLTENLGRVSLRKITTILFASSFAYATTPGPRIGGEPIRSFYLAKFIKKTKTELFATVVFERSTTTIALQFLYVFSYLFLVIFEQVPENIKIFLIISFYATLLWLIFRIKYLKEPKEIPFSKHLNKLLKWIYNLTLYKKRFQHVTSFQLYIKDRIQRYTALYFKFNENKELMNKQIVLGIFWWILMNFSVFFLFMSTGTHVKLLPIMIVQTIAMVIVSISHIPGGVGIQESIMVGLYYGIGINASVAATVALLNRAITYFYAFPVGIFSMTYLNKVKSK